MPQIAPGVVLLVVGIARATTAPVAALTVVGYLALSVMIAGGAIETWDAIVTIV